jgi:hypothetical protein
MSVNKKPFFIYFAWLVENTYVGPLGVFLEKSQEEVVNIDLDTGLIVNVIGVGIAETNSNRLITKNKFVRNYVSII